ncbi:Hypothetical protein CINCED_3A016574 [Cinara cedri]|uniref:Uncharacterized protein n=1 Tax=Cinara cedri TaxID=506608 RepID=A0A5E4NPL9_9HEMI|nr:Hypothetical protein CINCED_3A016574 [Cinara cedri]
MPNYTARIWGNVVSTWTTLKRQPIFNRTRSGDSDGNKKIKTTTCACPDTPLYV